MKKTKEKFVNKVYRLTKDRAPLSFMLPTRNTKRYPLLWFDEETGQNKALRYARNQKSPFEDEQDGNVLLDPIIFEDGFLSVPKTNQALQKFLELHPLNGFQFQEVNTERDAEAELEVIAYQADALIAARELTIEEAENLTKVIFGKDTSKMTSAEIKRDILIFAKQNPKLFIDLANDENVVLRNFAINAVEKHIIGLSSDQRSFTWKSNGRKLMNIPFDENAYSAMAAWFKTDEGLEVYKSIEKKLK